MEKNGYEEAAEFHLQGDEQEESICTGIPVEPVKPLNDSSMGSGAGGGHAPIPDPRYTTIAAASDWSSGLFDCGTDKYSMLDIFFCSLCNLTMQANLLFNNERGIHWPLCFCLTGMDVCCTGGLATLTAGIIVRQKTRQRYGLRQNFSEMVLDMLAGIFCQVCTMCQQHREMVQHGEWPGCLLFGEAPAGGAMPVPDQVHIV